MLRNLFPDGDPLTKAVLMHDFAPIESGNLPTLRGITNEQWRTYYPALIEQHLAGIATRFIREEGCVVPSDVLTELEAAHFQATQETVLRFRASLPALKAIMDCGIKAVVMKGPSISRLCVAVSDRPYGDLDVLVSLADYENAYRILKKMGYRVSDQNVPQREYFNRKCREGINLRDRRGGSIDLHHHVSPWFWSSRLTVDSLLRSAVSQPVWGETVPVTAPETSFLISALHLVSDHGRPGGTYRIWRDLLVTFACSDERLLISTAHEAGLVSWAQWIVSSLPEVVRPGKFVELLSSMPVDLDGKWRLRAMLDTRFAGAEHFSQLLRLPPTAALQYGMGITFPSSEFLRLRYGGDRHRQWLWWRDCWRYLTARGSLAAEQDEDQRER